MNPDALLKHFDQISEAPDAVSRLRRFILDLAVRGKLVPQEPNDEPASELLKRIQAEAKRAVRRGDLKREKDLPEIDATVAGVNLPANWELVPLIRLGRWAIGSGFPVNEQGRLEERYFFLKVSDMNLPGNEKYIRSAQNSINPDAAARMKARIHPARTIIFPKIGGAVATNKRRILTRESAIDNNCLGIIFWSVLEIEWCYLLLTSMDFTQYQAGTAVPALQQSVLEKIPVRLPPIAEQHRIVAKVDELMALCDELGAAQAKRERRRDRLVAASLHGLNNGASGDEIRQNAGFYLNHLSRLTKRPEHIHQLRQTILNVAIRGKLVPQNPKDEPVSELLKRAQSEKRKLIGRCKIKAEQVIPATDQNGTPFEIPDTWQWVSVSEIAERRLGKMLDKAKNRGTLRRYLRNVNVRWFDFELSDLLQMRFEDDELDDFSLRTGDVLICEGGEPGRAAVWDERETDIYFQKAIHRVRLLGSISPTFFVLCLRHDAVSLRLGQFFTGVGIRHFTGKGLARYTFPLPPLAEQHRIVAKVEELLTLCDGLEARIKNTTAARHQLLETTLHEALFGRRELLQDGLHDR